MTYLSILDNYNSYYNVFKMYTYTELINHCEKNKLSTEGTQEILIDRLAFFHSENNRPNCLCLCMKSIKNIFV